MVILSISSYSFVRIIRKICIQCLLEQVLQGLLATSHFLILGQNCKFLTDYL